MSSSRSVAAYRRSVPKPVLRAAAAALALLAACVAVASLPAPAAAQARPLIRPWTPPDADSLLIWAEDAKAHFRANVGDSVGGANYRGYEIVGFMGRKLLAALGHDGLLQANAVESVIDSLGLDTDIVIDRTNPHFAFMMVRNPFQPAAKAVGFLYWYREHDLRQQGVVMRSTLAPRMRVWWTADNDAPYEWGIVTEDREHLMSLLLLKMNDTATYWALLQYDQYGPDLGGPGEAVWAEVNRAGAPELIVWTHAVADSSFQECADCPHLIREQMFVENGKGYELYDSRLLPSPYTVFTLFIRLLQRGDRGAASRLLDQPARITDAIAQGWARRRPGMWKMEYADAGKTWPDWFEFRFDGPRGPVRYIVHCVFRDGRWLVGNWMIPRVAVPGKAIRP